VDDFNVKLKRKRKRNLQGQPATWLSFSLFRLVDSKPQFVCELGAIFDTYVNLSGYFWLHVRVRLDEQQVVGDVRRRIEEKIARTVPLPDPNWRPPLARLSGKLP
jgi:hypothetical protein